MMPCSLQSVQQKRLQLCSARRRHYFFSEILIALEEPEGLTPRGFDLVEVLDYFHRRVQSFRQRPLEGIVPKIGGEPAKGLFDSRRAAQHLLATRIRRRGQLAIEKLR